MFGMSSASRRLVLMLEPQGIGASSSVSSMAKFLRAVAGLLVQLVVEAA